MFNSFIGEKVIVVISTRADSLLEYMGTLSSESEDAIELSNVDVTCLLPVNGIIVVRPRNRIKNNFEKVIINKKYIISCDLFK